MWHSWGLRHGLPSQPDMLSTLLQPPETLTYCNLGKDIQIDKTQANENVFKDLTKQHNNTASRPELNGNVTKQQATRSH